MKTVVLGPQQNPLVKTYNEEDNIVAIDKYNNNTNFISAREISPYDHSILTNGQIREVIMTISSEKAITQEDLIKIINKTPV